MMQRHEFENRLSDYLRGELPADQRGEMEAYIDHHPEHLESLESFQALLPLAAQVGQDQPPAGLLEQARAGVLIRLESVTKDSPRTKQRRSGWLRPVYLSGVAALLAVIAAGLFWPPTRAVALADVAEKMKQLKSFRVAGWILGADGTRIPYRQWLQSPATFRAEVGEGAGQRVVVSDGIQKWIQVPGGAIYREPLRQREARTIEELGVRLYMNDMVAKQFEAQVYAFSREDLGVFVRFTIQLPAFLGIEPSGQQIQVDVDKESWLPQRIAFLWRQEGQWRVLGELKYGDYNADFPTALFQVGTGPSVVPVPPELQESLWYERSISTLFALFPVSPVPAGGVEVLTGPFDERGKGSSGMSAIALGGVAQGDFHHYPLKEIVRVLTGMPAEIPDTALAQQTFTLKINYLEKLPWQKLMAGVGPVLGVRAQLVQRQATRTRFTFVQDGRPFPVKTRWWGGSSLRISTQDSVSHYTFEGVKMADMLLNLFSNSRGTSFNPDLDTLVYHWAGPPAQNPFASEVDLVFQSSGTWEENAPRLQEKFGVRLERIPEPLTYEALVLTQDQEVNQ
jgi:anti-sigma factor RsiW